MRDLVGEARRHLSEASSRADSQLQPQLQSLDDWLEAVTGTSTGTGQVMPAGRTPRGRILQIEEKLTNLPEQAEGQTRLHLEYAVRIVAEYRRTHDFEE